MTDSPKAADVPSASTDEVRAWDTALARKPAADGLREALEPPICPHCDHDLSCAACGKEQPADYPAAMAAEALKLRKALKVARAALSQPAPSGRDEIAKILTKYFWTGEPGEHGAIKEATEALLALGPTLSPHDGGASEAVAWIVLSKDTDNLRIWWRDKERAEKWAAENDRPLVPLYAKPFAMADFLPLAAPPAPVAPQDGLAGLDERLDRLLLTADGGGRFVLSTESAKNIVGIVREWLRPAAPPAPVADRAAVIEECAEKARAAYQDCMNEFMLIGAGGMASRMVNAIRSLAPKGDGR